MNAFWNAGIVIAAVLLPGTAALAKDTAIKGIISYKYALRSTAPAAGEAMLQRVELTDGVIAAGEAANPVGEVQTCAGGMLVAKDGTMIAGHGYCDTIDGDGDVWWLTWDAGKTASTWTIVGGTGKFEGLKGTGQTFFEASVVSAKTTVWKQSFEGTITAP